MLVPLFLDHKKTEIYYVKSIVKGVSGKQYEIQDRISSGGNAVVHKCVNVITGDEFAIKLQLILSNKRRMRFIQEINLLKQIEHDQLIKYIDDGHIEAEKHPKAKYGEIPFLIMPLAESNLLKLIQDHQRKIPYEEYIFQFKGLSQALSVLHQKALHRDIKPENILIRGETWLLSDFGLCKFIDADECQDISSEHEIIGPRYWMSPEALNQLVGNNDEILESSDVFQLCSIFWFVVTGRHPTGVVSRDDWGTEPENIFDVIFNALSHNSKKRPSNGKELYDLLNRVTLGELSEVVET